MVDGNEMERKELTFSEDVEMFDLDEPENNTDTERRSTILSETRRIAKGLRRGHLGLELGASIFSIDGGRKNSCDSALDGGSVTTTNINGKGKSVRTLKLKAWNTRFIKKTKAYKTTRKKVQQKHVNENNTQSLISHFFPRKPNNNVIVGNNGGVNSDESSYNGGTGDNLDA